MLVVHTLPVAIFLCFITMLGWGSWANTQKLAGKTKWPFELYYWDYAIGVFLFSLLFAITAGSMGSSGAGALANLRQAAGGFILPAMLSGLIFNVSNILLVIGIDAAGMAVAFPVGVGLALVIGTVQSYLLAPQGNSTLLFGGVALIVFAMVMLAFAHARLPRPEGKNRTRGLWYSVVAGCLMGSFYPQLIRAMPGEMVTGSLTPYVALVFFALGVLGSNVVVNTVFMNVGKVTYSEYFRGRAKLHWLGILGGCIWMLALSLNVIASGVAGPAVSYALGQGATLIAALWGLLIWKEFQAAPAGTNLYLGLMLGGYTLGLILIGAATL